MHRPRPGWDPTGELQARLQFLGVLITILGLLLVAIVTAGAQTSRSQRRDPDRIGPAWLVTVGPPPVCGPRCRFRRQVRRVARIQSRWQQTFSGTHETNPFGTEYQQNPPRDFLRRVRSNATLTTRPRWAGEGLEFREHFGDFSEFPLPIKRR